MNFVFYFSSVPAHSSDPELDVALPASRTIARSNDSHSSNFVGNQVIVTSLKGSFINDVTVVGEGGNQ